MFLLSFVPGFFLSDYVEIDLGGLGHEALDGEEVDVFSQAGECGPAEDGLGNAVFGDEAGGSGGDVLTLQGDDLRAEVGSELDVGFEGALAFGIDIARRFDVDDVELGVDGVGEAGAAGDESAGAGASADADSDLFADGPMRSELLAFDVVVEGTVDGSGDALEGHFAKGDEISAAEEVGESALDTVGGVDVSAAHAGSEGLGGEIAHDDLIGAIEDPVGNGLPDGDSGEALDAWCEAFDVLDVDGGEDIDASVEKEKNVFVAFGKAASLDVGMGELVDEGDLWLAGEDGVDVHLREDGSLVIDLAAGHLLELLRKIAGSAAAV